MTISQSGKKINIAMIRGDSEALKLTCSTPFSAGDVLTFTVRESDAEGSIVLQKSVADFDDGVAYIIINPSDTSSLDFGDYVYDIQYSNSGGTVITLFDVSRFRLKEEVTY